MTLQKAIIKRTLELCAENHITVNKLATISGITQSTINNIIQGTTRNTTLSTIKKLCDGLKISLVEFFSSPVFDDLDPEVK